jgi:hypothetical protein
VKTSGSRDEVNPGLACAGNKKKKKKKTTGLGIHSTEYQQDGSGLVRGDTAS